MTLAAPVPLHAGHDLSDFNSGTASLDEWLRRRAFANQSTGASRTYVLCDDGRVVGYYALASGAVALVAAPRRVRRNTPDPVPVAILGRLAIDRRWQRKGLGSLLVRDAALRVLGAAETIGIRALLVHAVSAEAGTFYEGVGFEPSPLDPMTLMITLADIRRALES